MAHASPDARVLIFSLALSILTGVVFGLAPALSASRTDLAGTMKQGGHGSQDMPHSRLRGVLVSAETALAVMLLAAAGLLIGSFRHLTEVDPGFNPDRLLTFRLALPDARYPNEKRKEFFDRLVERVRSEPGVHSAAAMFPLPLGDSRVTISFEVEGRPVPQAELPTAAFRQVSSGYFEAMGIPMISGRDFSERDDDRSPGVVIVNQEFVLRFLPGEDPVGRRIRPQISYSGEAVMRTIVGVVGDVRHESLSAGPTPEYYIPYGQLFVANMTVVVRTTGDPRGSFNGMRRIVAAMDKSLPLHNVKTMEEVLSGSVVRPRFNALLLGIFACVALILTGVGLYGIVAYSVGCRTREIGLRMALGAGRKEILRTIVWKGLCLTLIGMTIGLLGAFVVTRLMSSFLVDATPADPSTLVTTAFILFGVSALASYIPARRATKVDSMVALRHE
jgi:putative ABC transport system permease protein